jgi:sodium-dependent dicarboxylate transporter 2/3/5
VGGSPARILAGIMFTTWLLSMWISNTAAVMMMLAAVVSVILIIQEQVSDADSKRIATACLIGLSYAATIGGMATLVGTPPNMVFYRFYTEAFPERTDINFIRWFQIAFPISLLLLITCFYILKAIFLKKVKAQTLDKKNFVQLKLELGERSRDQNVVLSIFLITILLWFTRSDIQLDSFTLKGWSGLFPTAEFIQDSTVAIVMSLLLFLIPSKAEKNTALLTWSEAGRLPFDIILLFGSGFALAKGFEVSGLSAWLAGTLGFLKNVPVWFVILSVTAMVCIISEFASNVASIQLVLPILLSLQAVLKTDPLVLMIPATLAASLGFMLPVATAPNTIVFGTGKIRVKEMLKTGFWMNLAGVMIISLLAYLFL